MRRNVAQLDEFPGLRDFLKAAASETRQRILFLYTDGKPRTVGQIASELKIVPSTASEHLAILKRGGLLKSERKAKEVYYQPDRARTIALVKKLAEYLTVCCPE